MLKKLSTALTAAALYATTTLGCASAPQFIVPEMPTTPEKVREFVMDHLPFEQGYYVRHGERIYCLIKSNLDEDRIPDLTVMVGELGNLINPRREVTYFDSSSRNGIGTVDAIKYEKKNLIVLDPPQEMGNSAEYVISEVMKTTAQQIRLSIEVDQYGKSRREIYDLDDSSQKGNNLEENIKKTLIDGPSQVI